MTTRTVEQVDEWGSEPFSGGYRALHDLADERFSGIVTVGPTRLCMTKGNVVGILDGDMDAFEGASGTVHEAPSPALPLLAVMQERADEVRAQYYTEETPISEVDSTLSDGNFTGYIELSENVLSGDYYLVYHQGRSMSVAFVGESKQLLTDEEAFERANGEVGIYKVHPVDIEVREIPEPQEPAGGAAATAEAGAEAAGEDSTAQTGTADVDAAGKPDDGGPARDAPGEASVGDAGGDATATGGDATASTDTPEPREDRSPDRGSEPARDQGSGGQQSRDQTADAAAGETRTRQDQTQSRGSQQPSTQREPRGETGGRKRGDQGKSRRGSRRQSTNRPSGGDTEPRGRVFDSPAGSSDSVERLETRSIPSLDPEQTKEPPTGAGEPDPEPRQPSDTARRQGQGGPQQSPRDSGRGTGGRGGPNQQPPEGGRQQSPEPSRQQPEGGRQQAPDGSRQQPPAENRREQRDPQQEPPEGGRQQSPAGQGDGRQSRGGGEPAPGTGDDADQGPDAETVTELESELEAKETEIEELESELASVEDERDDLREERDELAARVEELESRINELRTEEGGESVADRTRLGPGEAIDGTNLFIRYASKGEATLEKAQAGSAEAGAVNDNLEIQHHTQFEAEDVAVNGEPFTVFLEDTLQYKFVSWVVRVLPYEIRDTGHRDALKDLYDSLPKIDRAELNGAISVIYEEDGEEHRSQETFDIVLRDRMGNPLALANLNESRQPASQNKMESLITAASRVGESKETLAGAFLVTSSFFEPEAMEAASAATGGGLLSRDKRESFVKLSRKGGFHLCLVEAREEKFNLSVPEI